MHSEGRPVSGPDTVSDDARVLACVLRRLLRGDAPSPAQIGAELDLAPGKTEAVLARLHAAGVIDLVDGALRAAYPLSAVPTRHRLRIGSATAYANCAVDALAVPAMVAEPVAIESTCPQCGASIVVRTHGERLLSVRPEGAVVYLVSEACCAPGPAVLTRCPYINFFCDAAHAAAWEQAHPERRGTVVRPAEAAARARERFAPVVRVVRGDEVPLAELSRPRARGLPPE